MKFGKGTETIILLLITAGCLFMKVDAASIFSDSLPKYAENWDLIEWTNPWLKGGSVISTEFSELGNIGKTDVTGAWDEGKYRRPQQPGASQLLKFSSKKYQHANNWVLYGKFDYQQRWDHNVQWGHTMDPYGPTPYILGDSIGGDWRKQFFDLEVRMATDRKDSDWNGGLSVDYKVSTGAKQLDPRPLSYVNKIRISPSVSRKLSTYDALGFQIALDSYKEDISILIRRLHSTHNLYRFKGLFIYDDALPVSSGYNRNYKGRRWKGALEYTRRLERDSDKVSWKWWNEIAYETSNVKAVDGTTLPRQAGDFLTRRYSIKTALQKKNDYLQNWILNLDAERGKGTEYHVQYDYDSKTYRVNFSGVLYEERLYGTELAYQLIKGADTRGYQWRLGVNFNYLGFVREYKYIQPAYQEIHVLNSEVEADHKLGKLWNVHFGIGYLMPISENLMYATKTSHNATANSLLYPDHDYLSSRRMNGRFKVRRSFHFPFAEKTTFFCEALLNTDVRLDASSLELYGLYRTNVQICLGAYF